MTRDPHERQTGQNDVREGEPLSVEKSGGTRGAPLRLPQGKGSNLKSYSPTQLHFLMRLSQIQRQRRDAMNVMEVGDWRIRLINKSLYSTFRDCEDLGLGEEAKLLMQQAPENS